MTGSDRRPVDRQDFDRFATRLDGPALLVTTVSAAGERSGCLVGFATQCSIEPPRHLVCISERNHTFGVVADAELVAVHVVPPGAEDVAGCWPRPPATWWTSSRMCPGRPARTASP